MMKPRIQVSKWLNHQTGYPGFQTANPPNGQSSFRSGQTAKPRIHVDVDVNVEGDVDMNMNVDDNVNVVIVVVDIRIFILDITHVYPF